MARPTPTVRPDEKASVMVAGFLFRVLVRGCVGGYIGASLVHTTIDLLRAI